MSRPQIRHLALFVRDPEKMAKFYQEVFGMEIIHTGRVRNGKAACFLSDGHLTLALLRHRLGGSGAHGLNHFGFSVEDQKEIVEKLIAQGVDEPEPRDRDVPFAELRAVDPENNWFDISQRGFEEAQYRDERAPQKTTA